MCAGYSQLLYVYDMNTMDFYLLQDAKSVLQTAEQHAGALPACRVSQVSTCISRSVVDLKKRKCCISITSDPFNFPAGPGPDPSFDFRSVGSIYLL